MKIIISKLGLNINFVKFYYPVVFENSVWVVEIM